MVSAIPAGLNLLNQRVLVTGAAGFIGANLVRTLVERDADVAAVVRPNTDLWRLRGVLSSVRTLALDLSDAGATALVLQKLNPHYVIHTAVHRLARDATDAAPIFRENLRLSRNLLDGLESISPKRVIFLGSSTEYPERTGPLSEDILPDPATLFGVAKACTTLVARDRAKERNLPLVALRPFSVYGYWEGETRFIPTLLRAALGAGSIRLTPPGLRHDFIFIEDLLEGIIAALDAELRPGEIINLGTGVETANEEVVALIQHLSGTQVSVQAGTYPPHDTDRSHWLADIRKAERLLAWHPRHTLEDGLTKTLAWFRRQPGCGASE